MGHAYRDSVIVYSVSQPYLNNMRIVVILVCMRSLAYSGVEFVI